MVASNLCMGFVAPAAIRLTLQPAQASNDHSLALDITQPGLSGRIGKQCPVRQRSSMPATSPTAASCLDIFSPLLGDSEVIQPFQHSSGSVPRDENCAKIYADNWRRFGW